MTKKTNSGNTRSRNSYRRSLGMHSNITRRDFLSGASIGISGAVLFPSLTQGAPADNYYPPALTGLRGSHEGSFEAAHRMRDGENWNAADIGEIYDLVVVGGGLSGLAAAYFFRQNVGPDAKILILDNHDDFGGHAKRNEFTHNGRKILVNGGTLNLEEPSKYSTMAIGLLEDLGIDLDRYQTLTEPARSFHSNQGLVSATFFDRETFGEDRLVAKPAYVSWADFLAKTPLSEEVQRDIARLYDASSVQDYMPGLNDEEKKTLLASISYTDFLLNYARVNPGVIPFFQSRPHFRFYVGPEQVPALFCWEMDYPGFQGLNLRPSPPVGPLSHIAGAQHGREYEGREQSIYFPDGNATIARLLVRRLIPEALPGSSLEDAVTARLDYSLLDRSTSNSRLRLNSTVIDVQHNGDPANSSEVEISYLRNGRAEKIRAGNCILACWHTVIPHLCKELPSKQKQALAYGIKAPRVYTNVLLSNSRAFAKLGVRSINAPGSYHTSTSLQMPLSIGSYQGSRSADDPIVVRMHRAPCSPGLPRRSQHLAGRNELLNTSFETFEFNIRDQLARMLTDGDFDPARDIAAITVNRWPHGNAYAYGTLSEPFHWAMHASDDRPCVIARKSWGRISIANSDAAASPFTDAAIDEAYRAVSEVLFSRGQV